MFYVIGYLVLAMIATALANLDVYDQNNKTFSNYSERVKFLGVLAIGALWPIYFGIMVLGIIAAIVGGEE